MIVRCSPLEHDGCRERYQQLRSHALSFAPPGLSSSEREKGVLQSRASGLTERSWGRRLNHNGLVTHKPGIGTLSLLVFIIDSIFGVTIGTVGESVSGCRSAVAYASSGSCLAFRTRPEPPGSGVDL